MTQWPANWCNPTLPVTLSVYVSKSAPYYCFRCIFLTIHSHNSCDPDPVLIPSAGLSVSTPLGKQPDPPRIRVDRASRLLAPDRQHKPVRRALQSHPDLMVYQTQRRPGRKKITDRACSQTRPIAPHLCSTRTRANAQSQGRHPGDSLPNMTSTEHHHGLPNTGDSGKSDRDRRSNIRENPRKWSIGSSVGQSRKFILFTNSSV